jgi:hypothetical protein
VIGQYGLNSYIQNKENGFMLFSTVGTERMRIDASGNVGIGTTSASEKLTVNGSINLPTINTWVRGAGHNVLQVDATKTYFYGGTGGVQFRTADNASALVDITNAGNVSIGGATAYGTSKLSLFAATNPTTASSSAIQLSIGEASQNSSYSLKVGYINIGGGYSSSIQSITGGNPSTLLLNADGGNVGIGTTSPVSVKSEKTLHVLGNIKFGSVDGRGLLSFGDTASGNPNVGIWRGAPGAYAGTGNSLNLGGYDAIAFTVGSSEIATQTERMRIDGNGNVGIGTSSPSAKLHVSGIMPALTGGFGQLQVFSTNALAANVGGKISLGGISGEAGIYDPYGFAYVAGLKENATSTNFAGYLAFGTSNSGGSVIERLRIDSSGRLYLNQTAQFGNTLQRMGLKFDGNTEYGIHIATTSNTGSAINFANAAGTQIGRISVSASATGYITSSDYRLKTDVQPMSGASDRVLALKPVNFAWIVSGDRVDGFLAHETQEVVPEAIDGTKDAMCDEEYEVTAAIAATYDEDGNELTAAVEAVMGTRSVPYYQGIDQSKLVPLLTAALQEALTEITALKARVTALEGA